MQFAVVAFIVLTVVSSARAIQLTRPRSAVSVSVQPVHAFSNISQPSFALVPQQAQETRVPTPPAFALALVAALGLLAVITGISPALIDFKSVSPPTPAQAQPAASVPTPAEKPDEKPESKQAPIKEEAAIEEQETSAVVADEEDAQFVALPPRRPLARTIGAQTLPPHLRLQASARGVPDLVRTVTKRNMLRRQRAERLAQQQQLVIAKPALVMPVHPRLAGVPSLSLAVPTAPQLAMPTHPRLGTASSSSAAHPLAPVAMSAPTPGPRRRPAPLSLAPARTLSLTIVTDA